MQETMEHYPKYPDADSPAVKEFAVKVNAQLSVYRGKKGAFARAWVIA